jgi:hypothetical protein
MNLAMIVRILKFVITVLEKLSDQSNGPFLSEGNQSEVEQKLADLESAVLKS